jgi:DNA-binding transcriptional LysR family regulator
MDFQQLRYFIKSIENGNISQTAQELNISQPAVSKSIKKLEEEVESRLIERHGKGIKATKTGEALYKHAKTILNQIDRATDEIQSIKGALPEHLSIGCSPSLVDYVLPTIMDLFLKQWPNCTLALHKALYPDLLTALKSGELDTAIALDFHAYSESDMKFEVLGKSKIVFLVNPNHPLAKLKTISLKQMNAARWILLNVSETKNYFQNLFETNSLKPNYPVAFSNSMDIIKSSLLATELIGFLPMQMVQKELANRSLIEVNVDVPDREMDIVLAHNKTLFPSEILKSFLQISRDVICANNKIN